MRKSLLALPVLLLVAACSSSATPTPAASQAAAGASSAASAASTSSLPPVTTGTGKQVEAQPGQTVTVRGYGYDSLKVTVDQVKVVESFPGSDASDKPATSGDVFVQAMVHYTSLADGSTYNKFDWLASVDGKGSSRPVSPADGPTPALKSGNLPEKQQAEGYVVFEVPASGRVTMAYGNGRHGQPAVRRRASRQVVTAGGAGPLRLSPLASEEPALEGRFFLSGRRWRHATGQPCVRRHRGRRAACSTGGFGPR